jgi:hypothetical protein
MRTKTPPAQESAGTTDARITGPHLGYNRFGEIDHTYWQCQRCGAESVHRGDLLTCCQ